MGWLSHLANLFHGKTRVHTDGRKWKYNATKNVWKTSISSLDTTKLDATGKAADSSLLDGLPATYFAKVNNSNLTGRVSVGNHTSTLYGSFQVNQSVDNDEAGIGILNANANRSMRLWCDSTKSYISSGNSGNGILVLNQGTGNVGIGTSSPAEKLHVSGNIAVSGTVDGYDIATSFENKLANSTSTFGKVYHGHIGDYSTYVESVLTLFPLDQIDGNNCHVSGKFRAWRNNGCCSDVGNIWEGMIHKNYEPGTSPTTTVSGFSYSLQHYNNMPVCTFTYNGRPWLGIRLDEGLPHWAAISFTGFASNTHFGEVINYYDVRGTVINAEINNSITNQGITTSTY